MAYSSCSNRRVIDGRFRADPPSLDLTSLFTRGSGRSGGTTTAPLFSRIHTSLISLSLEHRFRFGLNGKMEHLTTGKMEHLTTHLHRPRTTRSPLSFWGDGGIVPFEPFFHAFPGGLEKQQSIGFP
ncbi:hypothetical protein C4D60_Mb00t02340 [Musa balbisiana]|uniref:Uncharacterized protein ycf68 n=1 Tax=Musa balbisiana TaxID=52838 RepID=A0A4S8I6G2_MUSBA|nr:hypothetical protein C4D60_Mb00t02340 [Musa balbisiana]